MRKRTASLSPPRRAPVRASEVRPKFFCARGLLSNPHRDSLQEMITVQQNKLKKFRHLIDEGRWDFIHKDHFDWYMFPIEDGSRPEYNVYQRDVQELRSDQQWLSGYHEAVDIVSRAWGWDVPAKAEVQHKQPGMGWTNWDVRLAKMIRSLWLFEEYDRMDSLQKFALHVKPSGLYYGSICLNEVYFMTGDVAEPEEKDQCPEPVASLARKSSGTLDDPEQEITKDAQKDEEPPKASDELAKNAEQDQVANKVSEPTRSSAEEATSEPVSAKPSPSTHRTPAAAQKPISRTGSGKKKNAKRQRSGGGSARKK